MLTETARRFEQPQAVLRAVLESPRGIVIFALDREYRYLAFNQNHARTMLHIWGVHIRVGDSMLDLIGRDDDRLKAKHNFDRALAGESFTIREEYGDERISRRIYDDVYSPIQADDGGIIGLTVYLTDITEQRRAEIELETYRHRLEELVQKRTSELEAAHAQLLRIQKLESMGVLAGGVAHDFNNLLAVILGRTELAVALIAADHAARAHIDVIRETSIEARMLTRQLVAYAGKGRFMVQAVELSELVESLASLLRASIRKSIVLSFDLCASPIVVQLDLTQARQLVLNLVTNAAEAIDGQGQVTIRTLTREVDDRFLRDAFIQSGVAPGLHACIEVEDSGCGMTEEVHAKLFDPFFTTKIDGHGLGLAAVLGIVTSHRGTIVVRSTPGRGSLFSILFPIANEAPAKVARTEPPPPEPFEGHGLALVVDDEAAVRATTAAELRAFGYDVIEAANGSEAAEIFRRQADRIEVVLLDLTMPGLSGEDTLDELRAVRGDVQVIVVTGYTEDEARVRFVREDLAGLLTKPFMRDELAAALRLAQRRRCQLTAEGVPRA